MKREIFDIAAGIVERIDKLEKIIFKIQDISHKKNFDIKGHDLHIDASLINGERYNAEEFTVNLIDGDLATEIFIENFFEFYINNLNLELDELRKSLEELH
ncbi:hypothetical protein M0Q97_09030 [Candidatus Dojkabacteria bacterium]|jgi:hypothetical protein|nr:hypothetical protein [Candidatus Dojkabacteria bacterium]